MRPKVRQISIVQSKGIFGTCNSCGSDILFYADMGVKCSGCGQLFGTWMKRFWEKVKQ